MTLPTEISSSTRPIPAALTGVVRGLKPGDRVRITQAVRINSRWGWAAAVEGVFRATNFLATGLATDRVPGDDIVVATVHFTKDNGELSSVTLSDSSKVEVLARS